MAYELPTDLITQFQISTRAQAGLSGYDPARSSQFPGLPSLSENVAALEPSPPYLRCKHCKGRLIRDVQSLLCIYCGRLNDVALPDPISFKDTFGYTWLLQSLQLDGSEIVEPPTEENVSKRGQSTPKDKIPLSDFLNLKILWPAEPEKPNIDVKNKKVEPSNSSLMWAGVELDNFFIESKREKESSIFERPVVSNQVETAEIKPVPTHDNLSLFQQPSESAFSSSGNKDFDSSGWQADFQPADTGNKSGASISFETTIGSTIDLSSHLDSVFGSGKDLKVEKSAAASLSDNPTSDDFWNDSSEVFQQAGDLDSTKTRDNVSNPSTSSAWFPGDEWTINDKNAPQSGITNEDNDFDDWNDFTGSSSAQDPFRSAGTEGDNQRAATHENFSEMDLFGSEKKPDVMDFNSFPEVDLFSGFSTKGVTVEVNNSLSEVPDRMVDATRMPDDAAGHGAFNIDFLNSSVQPKDNVQMLISQMHDLSFMLKDDLSIPSKSDNLHSFP